MKTPLLLLVAGLLASCQVPFATSSPNRCLNLSGMNNGNLRFQVNDSSSSKKPHGGYQRDYFVLVYEDQACTKLVNGIFLLQKSKLNLPIKLDPAKKNDYCVAIYKERQIIGDFQMEWDNKNAITKTASLWDRDKLNYYASTKTFLLVPSVFATTTIITSKDGAGGDGVRVMID